MDFGANTKGSNMKHQKFSSSRHILLRAKAQRQREIEGEGGSDCYRENTCAYS